MPWKGYAAATAADHQLVRARLPGALRRRSQALAVVAIAAVAVAACGGGDDDDSFEEAFPPVSERIVSLGQEVGDAIETAGESTDQELADDFDDFAQDLGDLRQQVDDLEPPDDLADERDELVAAMGEVGSSLEEIADAAEQGDPDAAREATLELVERSSELREARQTLARAVREAE